jgi:hypothetical protein
VGGPYFKLENVMKLHAKGLLVSAAVLMAAAGPAVAQTQDQMKMAYNSARNQLGVVEYCKDKGFADAETISMQQKMMGLIPKPADTKEGDEAEALGRKGTVSGMGVRQEMEAAAKAQSTTVEKLCQTLASAIKQAGASLPK